MAEVSAGQLVSPLLGVQRTGADNTLNCLGEGEAGENQFRVSTVQPGEREKVLNDMGHSVRFRDNDVEEAVGGSLGNISFRIPKGLGIGADVGQGSSKLMGDIGHELFPPFLVAVLLGDIMKDNEHASPLSVGKGAR